MKKILALMFAAYMLPAAAAAFQSATASQADEVAVLSADSGDCQSVSGFMSAEGAVKEDELVQVSGQSRYDLLPWGGLVPKMEMVTKIKLWDEPDRLPSGIEIYRAPGTIQNGLPITAAKP